jgi:DNA-directed RNA polymerase specialized sigma24 family protein
VVSEPRNELADVVSSGGEDFGAFAALRWPDLVRQANELTGDQAAAADLAQAALTKMSLAWWRVSRAGDPDEAVRRALLRASRRSRGRRGRPG